MTSMPSSLVDCIVSASRVALMPSLYGGTHIRGLVAPAWCRMCSTTGLYLRKTPIRSLDSGCVKNSQSRLSSWPV